MRIGILTFHRAHNYGAVLQCYALQSVLEKMGHNVYIINYLQPHIEELYKPKIKLLVVAKKILFLRFGELTAYLVQYRKDIKATKNFRVFCNSYLHCTEACNSAEIPQDFDTYIIGSDQMWCINCTNGYDAVYWGGFKRQKDSKLVGYAISANGDYHDYLSMPEIIQLTDKFNNISFREITTCNDINEITGRKYSVTLDPTLLTNESTWEPMINRVYSKKKYVVLYQVRHPKDDVKLLDRKARRFAEKEGVEVVDLSNMDYTVEDFVSLIKYAYCVITSSFHATVFSIIFGTPFFSFKLDDGHDERYVDLLNKLGLEQHIMNVDSELIDISSINRVRLNQKMCRLIESSYEFLKEI